MNATEVAQRYLNAWNRHDADAIVALSEWHFGEIASCHANMAEAISLAKELNDMHGLALALYFAGGLAHFERDPAKVERSAGGLARCFLLIALHDLSGAITTIVTKEMCDTPWKFQRPYLPTITRSAGARSVYLTSAIRI